MRNVSGSSLLIPFIFKVALCCAILVFLSAFDLVKDSAYFHVNKDEARALLEGRCKWYKGQSDLFVKDSECSAAMQGLQESAKLSELQTIVEELAAIKDNIRTVVIIDDSNKLRYNRFVKLFKEDLVKTEDFVVSCMKNPIRFPTNDVECLAAVEVILEIKENKLEEEVINLERESKYREYYRQYFRTNRDKIDEILSDRCEDLLANPWYKYDPDIQDKKCNIALEERRRFNRLENIRKLENEEKNKRDVEYYRNNIAEAEELVAACDSGEVEESEKKNCEFAKQAVFEKAEEERKSLEFQAYFEKNLPEAKTVIDKCQSKEETDKLKCEMAFFVINKNIKGKKEQEEFNRYLKYFEANMDEARRLSKGRCSDFTSIQGESIFIEDDECSAVKHVLKEHNQENDRNELLRTLKKFRDQALQYAAGAENATKKNYTKFKQYFKSDHMEAESFVAECISEPGRLQKTAMECIASMDAIAEKLEEEKRRIIEKEEMEAQYRDYYRRFFMENTDKVDELLEGRCRVLFANQWYEYDTDIKDEECEAALAERKRLDKIERQRRFAQEQDVQKDAAYYRRNIETTRIIAENCSNGIVNDLLECEMSLKTVEAVELDKQQEIEYYEFYKGHLLAAKFHLRWCKSAMLNFDTKCRVVDELLKNHKDKEKDPEKVKEYTEYFNNNPFEAKLVTGGKCADKLSDPWYYLDINIQTEECDAAAEAAR